MNGLQAVAAFGLDHLETPELAGSEDLASLVHDAERHRLTGLLAAAVRSGRLDPTADIRIAREKETLVDQFSDRASEWFSSIMVKEARQGGARRESRRR